MSRVGIIGGICAAALACGVPACAQYPGHINTSAPTGGTHLRATSVLEYTGTLKHITASRLVPIVVWDGLEYEPGGLYLANPAPLAVQGGTQYELEKDGKPQGFYNLSDADQIAERWVGVGHFQAPKAEAKLTPMKHLPQVVGGTKPAKSGNADQPHFAHVPQQDQAQTAQDSGVPALHKRPANASAGSSNPDISGQGIQVAANAENDSGPTLHRRGEAASGALATANSRPIDPNRPRLSYASPDTKPKGPRALIGMPADMHQVVAVSDSSKLDTQSWAYDWPDSAAEAKMQAALEKIAEQALAPAKPAQKPAARGIRRVRHSTPAAASAQPQLEDIQFRAFSLTFGSGATLVFSARTGTSPVRYITIVAQPDFTGTPQVLLKRVTNGNELDAVPRLRLIDAVDTTGIGRADLLFEERGYTYRQFAIYRIYGGAATRLFVTQPISTPQAVVDPNSLS